jgi:hypothetical protein
MSRERDPGTHWIGGWVGPRASVDVVVKRKIPSQMETMKLCESNFDLQLLDVTQALLTYLTPKPVTKFRFYIHSHSNLPNATGNCIIKLNYL